MTWEMYLVVEHRIGGDEDWFFFWRDRSLLWRNSARNACLRGLDNHLGFAPVFPDRDLPDDLSAEATQVLAEHEDGVCYPSWLSWQELARVDWDARSSLIDERIYAWVVDPQGNEELRSIGAATVHHLHPPSVVRTLLEDPSAEVREGDTVYRRPRQRPTRREQLDGSGFDVILKMLAPVAEFYGEENVRLLIWFDQ